MIPRPKCVHCGSDGKREILLRARLSKTGMKHIGWQCQKCLKWVRDKRELWISQDKVLKMIPGHSINEIPIVNQGKHEKCVRCGVIGPAEAHHFAPRAIFSDPDEWPVMFLCRNCHMEWHTKINAYHVENVAEDADPDFFGVMENQPDCRMDS